MDESVAIALCTLEDTGTKQYQDFVTNILVDCTASIHEPIKKNSLALFKRPQLKATSKQGKKIKLLQNNNYSTLRQAVYLYAERDGDLGEFFSHEIQSFPPSLSDLGKLHLPNTKSDLLKCLELPGLSEPPSTYDCIVLARWCCRCVLFTYESCEYFWWVCRPSIYPLLEKAAAELHKSRCCVGHIPCRELEGVYSGEEG